MHELLSKSPRVTHRSTTDAGATLRRRWQRGEYALLPGDHADGGEAVGSAEQRSGA